MLRILALTTAVAAVDGKQLLSVLRQANEWTLEETGSQCFWDKSRTDCAKCATGACQCAEQKNQHVCVPCGKELEQCGEDHVVELARSQALEAMDRAAVWAGEKQPDIPDISESLKRTQREGEVFVTQTMIEAKGQPESQDDAVGQSKDRAEPEVGQTMLFAQRLPPSGQDDVVEQSEDQAEPEVGQAMTEDQRPPLGHDDVVEQIDDLDKPDVSDTLKSAAAEGEVLDDQGRVVDPDAVEAPF